MLVALCLYGQPRKAREGHANLATFMQNHPEVEFHVYLHAWHDARRTHYDASPWRSFTESDLRVDPDVDSFLLQCYRPVAWRIDPPPQTLDVPGIQASLLYRGSDAVQRQNLANTLSQLYSRQAVRDLVLASGRSYDLVVATRFDFLRPIALDLHRVDTRKLHVAHFHLPRVVFPDNFVVASPTLFLDFFNAYEDLGSVMNDDELSRYGEPFNLTIESILLANFFRKHSLNDVIYTPDIPDFR